MFSAKKGRTVRQERHLVSGMGQDGQDRPELSAPDAPRVHRQSHIIIITIIITMIIIILKTQIGHSVKIYLRTWI